MTIFCKRVHAICLRVKLHMPNFQGPLITGMKTQAITDVTVSICTALLVEGSRGRSPVPGEFFPGASDSSMCPGVDSASKYEYQDIPGGKDGRCVRVKTLPPSCAECLEILEP